MRNDDDQQVATRAISAEEARVLAAVRSLERRRPVTDEAIAKALGVGTSVLAPVLETLIEIDALRCTRVGIRKPGAKVFATRYVWYHSPEAEPVERFGDILTVPRGFAVPNLRLVYLPLDAPAAAR
jgi:hypothetical protein